MSENDKLISESLQKLHKARVMEAEEYLDNLSKAPTNPATEEENARKEIHAVIQDTIGGFIRTMDIIEIESKELAAKSTQMKRKLEAK